LVKSSLIEAADCAFMSRSIGSALIWLLFSHRPSGQIGTHLGARLIGQPPNFLLRFRA
jgi:hypothetical protein